PAGSAGRSGIDVQQHRHAVCDASVGQSPSPEAEGSGAARIVLNNKPDPIGAVAADVLVSKRSLESAHKERECEPAAAIFPASAIGQGKHIISDLRTPVDHVAVENPAQAIGVEAGSGGKLHDGEG